VSGVEKKADQVYSYYRLCGFIGKRLMREKRPFLEDGSQYGVSRTAFRHMRKADKRDLMRRTVFGQLSDLHFNPYDAAEQLHAKFGDYVSEQLLEEVVKEVESDGVTDWGRHHPEHKEEEQPSKCLPSLNTFSDQPSLDYGTSRELEARGWACAALDELQRTLDQVPIGIGHNRPRTRSNPKKMWTLFGPPLAHSA
jgi:hypothetical protein